MTLFRRLQPAQKLSLAKASILSVDIGTSSVRACVFDATGRMLPRTLVKAEHSPSIPAAGASEFDSVELMQRTLDVIDRVAAVTGDPVEAVAMSAFWHGIVGVDERGRATTPVLTWADRRSREFTPLIKERLDETASHRRTGAHFHSSFWPAKLMWFRERQPLIWRKTARWCSFPDLIAERLFGECVTSISMASATGIFDQRRCLPDAEMLRFLKLRKGSLARIAADGETFRLTRRYARRWPTLAKADWFAAVGDGAADHIGSCGPMPGTASLMIGTSAAMRSIPDGGVPGRHPRGLWCYRIDGKRAIVGGALSDGGNLHHLIRERFGLAKNCDALVAAREPDDGLTVIPFFFGERSTGYNEEARGAMIGLTSEHDGIDVLRAAMEGVAFRLADIQERMNRICRIDRVIASGGALLASRAWQQIAADALGRRLEVSDVKEASLRGAALLALETTGKM